MSNEPVPRKQADQESGRTLAAGLRDSLHRVSLFYENTNRIYTTNFAGGEDNTDDEDDNEADNLESYLDSRDPEQTKIDKNTQLLDPPNRKYTSRLSMNLSKYQYINQKGELSFWSTLFTFIKVNIVAGFLFLPSGFNNGGWLFSVIALFFIASVTVYCNIAISECTEEAHTYSFSRIGLKAAGKCGFYIVEFGIAISQICFPCSYANLITQVVNNMLNLWFNNNTNYYVEIAIVLALILIPLCLIRNITKFAAFHIIGDIAVLATVITLSYEAISIISKEGGFDLTGVKLINTGWAKLLGMSITSLEGIGVILPIKENMKDKKHFNKVVIIGTFVISTILAGFPLIMYFCYQDKVNEIVLNNLPLDKLYIQIVLLLLIFSILIVYPVTLFPSFKVFESLWCKKKIAVVSNAGANDKINRKNSAEVSENANRFSKVPVVNNKNSDSSLEKATAPENYVPEGGLSQYRTKMIHSNDWKTIMLENCLRAGIVCFTIIVGILSINRFDTLLALVGCGICTPIALIFPSTFHFLLYKHKQSKLRNCFDLLICFLGCSLSLVVLIFTII